MKIRIVKHVPVSEKYRPKVGEIYEATELDYERVRGPRLKYEIEVNGEKVKLYGHEVEIVT